MSPKNRPVAPSPLVASTAARLAGIVEAAERAASRVIDDAEVQARQRLDEAEDQADRLVAERLASLADLTDSLVTQAEGVRSQSEGMLSSLQDAKDLIRGTGPDGDTPAAEAGRTRHGSHLTAVAPFEGDIEAPSEPLPPESERATPAGARLLATQMAVSGSSREEIEARLRSGFEIEDTGSILDAILGPED